jgi:hypothetical protein
MAADKKKEDLAEAIKKLDNESPKLSLIQKIFDGELVPEMIPAYESLTVLSNRLVAGTLSKEIYERSSSQITKQMQTVSSIQSSLTS